MRIRPYMALMMAATLCGGLMAQVPPPPPIAHSAAWTARHGTNAALVFLGPFLPVDTNVIVRIPVTEVSNDFPRLYILQRCTNLINPVWQDILWSTNTFAPGLVFTNEPNAFYRLGTYAAK